MNEKERISLEIPKVLIRPKQEHQFPPLHHDALCPVLLTMEQEFLLAGDWTDTWRTSIDGADWAIIHSMPLSHLEGRRDEVHALENNARSIFIQNSSFVGKRKESTEPMDGGSFDELPERITKNDFIARLSESHANLLQGINKSFQQRHSLPLPGMLGQRVFNSFDTDHSGDLDFKEMFDAVVGISFANLPSLIGYLFTLYDLDGSRSLSQGETGIMMDHLQEYLREFYLSMSEDAQPYSETTAIIMRKMKQTTDSFRKELVQDIFIVATHLEHYKQFKAYHASNDRGSCPELIEEISITTFVQCCLLISPIKLLLSHFFEYLIPIFECIIPGLTNFKSMLNVDYRGAIRVRNSQSNSPRNKSSNQSESGKIRKRRRHRIRHRFSVSKPSIVPLSPRTPIQRANSESSTFSPTRRQSEYSQPGIHTQQCLTSDSEADDLQRVDSVTSNNGDLKAFTGKKQVHFNNQTVEDATVDTAYLDSVVCPYSSVPVVFESITARRSLYSRKVTGVLKKGYFGDRYTLLWMKLTSFHLFLYASNSDSKKDPLNPLAVYDIQNITIQGSLNDDGSGFNSLVTDRYLPWASGTGHSMNTTINTSVVEFVFPERNTRDVWHSHLVEMGGTSPDVRFRAKYELMAPIGHGSYSRVFCAINRQDKESPLYAVKVIGKFDDDAVHKSRQRGGKLKRFQKYIQGSNKTGMTASAVLDAVNRAEQLKEYYHNEISIMRLLRNTRISCKLQEVLGNSASVALGKSYVIMEFMDTHIGSMIELICSTRYNVKMPHINERIALMEYYQNGLLKKYNINQKEDPFELEDDPMPPIECKGEVRKSFECTACFTHTHDDGIGPSSRDKVPVESCFKHLDKPNSRRPMLATSIFCPPWEQLSKFIIKKTVICLTILHSNDRNVVHRDIKPENIMIKFKHDKYLDEKQSFRTRSLVCDAVLNEYRNLLKNIATTDDLIQWVEQNSLPEDAPMPTSDESTCMRRGIIDQIQGVTSDELDTMIHSWINDMISLVRVVEELVTNSQDRYKLPTLARSSDMSMTSNSRLTRLESKHIFASTANVKGTFEKTIVPRRIKSITSHCHRDTSSTDNYDGTEEGIDGANLEVKRLKADIIHHKLCVRSAKLAILNWLTRALEHILDSTMTLKLGDFGFAHQLAPSTPTAPTEGLKSGTFREDDASWPRNMKTLSSHVTDPVGTPAYCAPEVVQEQTYNVGIDLWSLGIMSYQMLSGGFSPLKCCWLNSLKKRHTPVFHSNVEDVHRDNGHAAFVGPGILTIPCDTWSNVSIEAKGFTNRCLTVVPGQRISASHALEHPWLAETEVLMRSKPTDRSNS